jgi:excisionase family DNA binding protein
MPCQESRRRKKSMVEEKLLTVAEVGERCNVRSETVLRWIHSRRIAAIVLQTGHYRIVESELDKVLKAVGS